MIGDKKVRQLAKLNPELSDSNPKNAFEIEAFVSRKAHFTGNEPAKLLEVSV